MKQAIIALTLLTFTGISANAQSKTTTTTTVRKVTTKAADTLNYAKNYKVCKGKATYYVCGDKPSGRKKTVTTSKITNAGTKPAAVHTTAVVPGGSVQSPNAKNFKVCKGKGNYHICDEKPNSSNSVPRPKDKIAIDASDNRPIIKTTTITENGVIATTTNQTMTQPSAPVVPQSQSIADQSTNTLAPATVIGHIDTINNANAPYHGKNSPQYDGPAKNKQRNINTPPQSPNSIPAGAK